MGWFWQVDADLSKLVQFINNPSSQRGALQQKFEGIGERYETRSALVLRSSSDLADFYAVDVSGKACKREGSTMQLNGDSGCCRFLFIEIYIDLY